MASTNAYRFRLLMIALSVAASCKTVSRRGDESRKIFAHQIEPPDQNYNPSPGFFYLWNSEDSTHRIEIDADGNTGRMWVNQQKSEFARCEKNSGEILCSGSGWTFTAPMRMDASHHIYGAALLEQTE